jgi:hypothetical protein
MKEYKTKKKKDLLQAAQQQKKNHKTLENKWQT